MEECPSDRPMDNHDVPKSDSFKIGILLLPFTKSSFKENTRLKICKKSMTDDVVISYLHFFSKKYENYSFYNIY